MSCWRHFMNDIKKFTEVLDISDYEVLTDTGWEDISKSNKTIQYNVYKIILSNGLFLKCADNHILIEENGTEVYAINSLHKNINTIYGVATVIDVINLNYKEEMYDLSVNSEKHLYYTNGILSHNTTTNAANIVWHLCFKKEFTVGIVANTASLTTEIVGMVQQMYELLPAFLQSGVRKWSATRLELENKCKVLSAVAGPSALRGRSISYLLVDETAFIEPTKIKGFFDSVMPALSSGTKTKIVLISTPNGFNEFFNIFKGAEEGTNGYVAYEADWTVIPGRDEAWKEAEIASTSVEEFMRNHQCAFLGSSKTLLKLSTLEKLPVWKKQPIDFLDHIHPEFKVYEHPINADHIFYTLSCDSAKISGTAKENSDNVSIQITKFDTHRKKITQVATLTTREMHYLELAEIVHDAAVYYNNALVQIENNSGDGQSTVDRLFEVYEYENIYSDSSRHDVLGYRTTRASKARNLSNLKKLIEEGIFEICDIPTIDEFYTFVQVGSTFKAQNGLVHDDAIMALAGNLHFLADSSNEMEFSINDIFERKVTNEHGEEESNEDIDWVGTSNQSKEQEDASWLFGS